ncbi:Protoporphyrinogen oxidase [Candidatus Sulfotelmatobacter kueseliae]|uniref:Coproporphyrinogen III oxidase n=1 Tax=Candidatus Sulfotelmatobacter kueseliae TaxID=2042962 RepID=A0A2U3K4G2_9BACT|nr:Protoporphyrinogen oxidase [Candidatus Sulfotelmatobacter kueseliae]
MTRIAIIGGGISGLSAAYELEQRRSGIDLEYVLYEASPVLGGVLCTEHIDGCVVEAGPDSFITEKPWAADLCRELGLEDQLIGSNDAERKTYILVGGRLVVMPDGLMFMVPTKILPTGFSPLFSWKTKLRMTQELFHPPRAAGHDESVAAFVERHYGSEMVDRLADPLLSGVYGGEAANLSVRAVLPRFAEMERTYGSLGRAMLAARRRMRAGSRRTPPPLFTSLKNGMQHLAETVVSRLNPSALLTDAPVQAIQPEAGGWVVSAGLQSDQFDAVVVALPAAAAARVLRFASPELSAELAAIDYSSSITVGLGYDRSVRQSLPPGFGFLVPRSEGRRLLAATFVHNKFPHRAPEDRALLRCFFAGVNAENVWPLSNDQIVGIVRQELEQIISLRAEPLFARVYKWKSAMAQYAVGHLERLERIERLRQQLPGLALAGNAFRGIGVPDCVRSGREAAKELTKSD